MCWLRARGRQPPAPAGLGTGTRPAPGRQRPGRPTVATSAALSLGCADSGDSPVSHAPRGHPQGLSPWWTGPAPPPQAPTATYCAAPVVGGGGGVVPSRPRPAWATGPDQPLPPGRRGSGEGAKPRQALALTPQHLTRKLGERVRPYWATSSSSDPSRSREDTAPSACAPLFPPPPTPSGPRGPHGPPPVLAGRQQDGTGGPSTRREQRKQEPWAGSPAGGKGRGRPRRPPTGGEARQHGRRGRGGVPAEGHMASAGSAPGAAWVTTHARSPPRWPPETAPGPARLLTRQAGEGTMGFVRGTGAAPTGPGFQRAQGPALTCVTDCSLAHRHTRGPALAHRTPHGGQTHVGSPESTS